MRKRGVEKEVDRERREKEMEKKRIGKVKNKDKKNLFFFFNDTATTEIYTLSLHDALPILWDHYHCQFICIALLLIISEVVPYK